MKQKPAFILDVRLPTGDFDVNVTPDKREIFLTGVRACGKDVVHSLHTWLCPPSVALNSSVRRITRNWLALF